jgi:D-serine deaminase-like pyridoxal phosphate-dependent protein
MMRVQELSTPALTVDLEILEQNLQRMADYCHAYGLGLRPHTKTHKIPEIARKQLRHGAIGLTVAKVGEAEVMCGAGLNDLLIAYPVFGADKLRRVVALTHNHSILMSLDNEVTAQALSAALAAAGTKVGVLVEFDTGLRRCGLQPGPACVDLARKIQKLPGLEFRGLMTYPGFIAGNEEDRKRGVRQTAELVEKALEAFRREKVRVDVVSAGSTPSAFLSHEIPGITEIRPGTYVYNDLNTFYQGACKLEDCAARVVATVVSTAVPGRAMVDAGSKTLSSDALRFGPARGFGYLVEAPDIGLIALNEEHGYLDLTNSSRRFKVGDVVSIIPNHVCACVNMHEEIFLVRKGNVEGSWHVAARGKIR